MAVDMSSENQAVSLTDQGCSDILQGLVISSWQPDVFRLEEEKPMDDMLKVKENLQNLSVSSKMFCSVCNAAFHSRDQQTEHYKLDWHRFNLKQKLMGVSRVDEEVFEAMTGDISSISGSDDDDDDDVSDDISMSGSNKSHVEKISSPPQVLEEEDRKLNSVSSRRSLPKVFFKNHKGQLVAIYRCLLQGKKEGLLTQSELVSRATNLPTHLKWTILMAAGGHFAAAVFKGLEVIRHKTFHRYTVRAKRGTAQGIRDNMHGGIQPRSAGASLRRYNEMQMHEDVGNLIRSWKDDIAQCSCIFIRAPSYNKTMFFGGKNPPMKRDDDRIRTIPFPTRRPTFKEVQRVKTLLSTVDCFDDADAAEIRFFSGVKSFSTKQDKEETVCPRTGMDGNESLPPAELKDGTEDVKLNLKTRVETVCDDSPEEEIEFVLEEATSFTSNLKETEIFIPKQRKRRKKKTHPPLSDYTLKDKQLRKLQAAIFTCCKTGEDSEFDHLITKLREKLTQDMQMEMKQNSAENEIDETYKENGSDGAGLVEGKNERVSGNDAGNKDSMAMEKLESSKKSYENSFMLEEEVSMEGKSGNKISNFVESKEDLTGEVLNSSDGVKKETFVSAELEVKELTQKHVRLENHNGKVAKFLNEKLDGTENTFLHIAAQHGQVLLLWKLMSNGANPALKCQHRSTCDWTSRS